MALREITGSILLFTTNEHYKQQIHSDGKQLSACI